MAPTRLGDGTNIGSIRQGDGTDVQEITVDGDVVFSASGVNTFNDIGIFGSADSTDFTSISNNSTISIGSGFADRTIYVAAVQNRSTNTSVPELDNNAMTEEVRSNADGDAWAAIYSYNDNGALGSSVVFDYKGMSNAAFRFFTADAGVASTSTGTTLNGQNGAVQLYAFCVNGGESGRVSNLSSPSGWNNVLRDELQPFGDGVNDHGDGGLWAYNNPGDSNVAVPTNLGTVSEQSAVAVEIF
jgi:hypothetical protein